MGGDAPPAEGASDLGRAGAERLVSAAWLLNVCLPLITL